jgi:hypothetical protein
MGFAKNAKQLTAYAIINYTALLPLTTFTGDEN